MSFKFYRLTLFLLLLTIGFQAQAQRYLTPQFTTTSVTTDVVYGNNITVLTGQPTAQDLLMDVYTPDGDTDVNRPVVVYFHTGSFLPPLFNGGITGARSDSTVVEVCNRLTKLGYVAIAATYRAGWVPTAVGPAGQDTRTGTLLQAAYRGIQDARACIRFLRRSVAEDSNPYGIDPEKIVLWGQGTGGYISIGTAYLDRFEEVLLPKFLNSTTLQPYVDTTLLGNVNGTTQKPLCTPNHVGYSSDFALAVNMGGALGDTTWIDGSGNEPPTIGYHVVKDPFAPFDFGAVIVPTTGDFVVNVSGTRGVVGRANRTGVNDAIVNSNSLSNQLNAINDVYKTIPFVTSAASTTLSTDNMYPFLTDTPQSGPWDWWDLETLRLIVAGTNQQLGTDFNADTLHRNGLLTNPNMSPMQGKAYVDTIMAYYLPRACEILQLEDCCTALGFSCTTGTNEVLAEEFGLVISPNPATDMLYFRAEKAAIEDIQIFDVTGRVVRTYNNVNEYQFEMPRNGLAPGIYITQLRFGNQMVSNKVVFE